MSATFVIAAMALLVALLGGGMLQSSRPSGRSRALEAPGADLPRGLREAELPAAHAPCEATEPDRTGTEPRAATRSA